MWWNKSSFGELDIVWPEPIQCDKSFELSVLLISEYLKNDPLARACGGSQKLSLRELRGTIAHHEPTNTELVACIDLFKGNTSTYHFLTSL